jgi:hypothetical protein
MSGAVYEIFKCRFSIVDLFLNGGAKAQIEDLTSSWFP